MLIKSADDKTKRVTLLQDLQKSPLLDARQNEWLRIELRNLTAGIKGEREAAFHLDGHYKDGQNNVLLHDLRFKIDGDVAQIDHLVINRTGYMVLIETKNYSGDLEVCGGQVISDSLIGFVDVDSRSKALGDKLPSFECSLMLL